MPPRSRRNWSAASGLWATEIEIGPPGRRRHGPHGAELVVEVGEVGDHLQDALPDGPERLGDAHELSALGPQRRCRLTPAAAVVARAGRGEPQRPGGDALGGQLGHQRDVVVGGGLARCPPVAHHVQAQRAVGHLGGEVDVVRTPFEGVEVLGKRLPLPRDAFVQRGAGDVLDAFHELDEPIAVGRTHRREAHAAVAHHHGGDPVPRRGRQPRVPHRLAVVVRVDVDDARASPARRRRRSPAAPAPSTRPTAVTVSPSMATSAVQAGAPVPSMTVPPRMTRSWVMGSLQGFGQGQGRGRAPGPGRETRRTR